MNTTNGADDGVPPAPPDRPILAEGGPKQSSTPSMHCDENPVTKIIFQAKIDVIRNRNDDQPLPIKALMIDILLQHQRVDPTFHFLPTEDGSNAGVLTTASDIPNNDTEMKKYIKEMRDVENRNNGKTYSVVFFVKIASTMTTGMMKRDSGFYKWLTTKNIFIRPFPFTKTFDVVNTGFISHMNGTLHNRDKINATIQTALKTHYPQLEVKLVPTTIKHGPDKKTITQVVSLQADRKQLNEAREALAHVFTLSANHLPKDIFFVPSPANGMIKQELFYALVNAHHEHMANIRSFAISGVSNLNAKIMVQDTTDETSSVMSTLKQAILTAKVPGTTTDIFSSIETTSFSDSDGRFLLLTEKKHIGAAEYMIDELIQYIKNNPDVNNETTIPGDEIRRTNRVNVSNHFNGYNDFLGSKVPQMVASNPSPNAWHKRRETTPLAYNTDHFPALPNKNVRSENRVNESPTEANTDDSVLVDLDVEMAKERAYNKKCLDELKDEFNQEIQRLKMEFKETMEKSEKQMQTMLQEHTKEITRQSGEATTLLTTQNSNLSEQMSSIMKLIQGITSEGQHQNSPARKQQRIHSDGTPMDEDTPATPPATTPSAKFIPYHLRILPPASPDSLPKRNGSAGRRNK
jgi:hypothetical protein